MEEWKTINNYSFYEVSNTGKIRTNYLWGSKISNKGNYRYLAGTIKKNGYVSCQLYSNGKRKKFYIYRVVLSHFFGDSEKPCVNHIDGNKKNNDISNLEWVTYSENMRHAIANGLNKVPNRWKR